MIRSDIGPKFIAFELVEWLVGLGADVTAGVKLTHY